MSTQQQTFELTSTFLLAGKAIFTVHNASGEHYTFRVKKLDRDDRGPIYFLSVLHGPDNEDDDSWHYVGIVTNIGGVRLTKASRHPAESKLVRVATWAIGKIFAGTTSDVPDGYGIHSEGRCGRCGRLLTHPDGVSDTGYRHGFGPACWNKIKTGK